MYPCISLVGGSEVVPRNILKTKNAREAISGHFAKRFKVSNSPELCLFAAVSEEKVPINVSLKCL